MTGREYASEPVNAKGWSRWIRPVRMGYRLACCDCGLIHEIDFALIGHPPGKSIVFRARRDSLATAAHRRSKK